MRAHSAGTSRVASTSNPACLLAARAAILIAVAAAPAPFAAADEALFTSDTTISDANMTYENADVIVRGCTLTINGAHAFHSLTVERNAANAPGVVTHAANFTNAGGKGFSLTIAADVLVQGLDGSLVASRIDVTERGYPSATGPGAGTNGAYISGGAAHGGMGGAAYGGQAGGAAYGSLTAPADFGSGGGYCWTWGAPGGAGGGCATLNVAGTLTVNGEILAHGGNGNTAYDTTGSGGGAGGSINLTATTLAGSGAISANGGYGRGSANGTAGGGAGGRVAIACTNSSFAGALQAHGHSGFVCGGAGTVYTRIGGATYGELLVDNAGYSGAVTPPMDLSQLAAVTVAHGGHLVLDAASALTASNLTVLPGGVVSIGRLATFTHVVIQSGGRIQPIAGATSFELEVPGDLTVDAGGAIFADGLGHPAATGPGAGVSSSHFAGGGGYGGAGGASNTGAAGGPSYGQPAPPLEMGSGGGSAYQAGGPGGGLLKIHVTGTLTLNGDISANGAEGLTAYGIYGSGGGSGGGIDITAGYLAGTGNLFAKGGVGPLQAGGGGGGRIAVELLHCSKGITSAHVRTTGGTGYHAGARGTLYFLGNPCDTNCDGTVNQFDIQPFIDALIAHHGCSPCAADANGDGSTNTFDINGFIECLVP